MQLFGRKFWREDLDKKDSNIHKNPDVRQISSDDNGRNKDIEIQEE